MEVEGTDKQYGKTPLRKGQEQFDERLIMLCDGVFAIAMTLLVLDIKLDIQGGRIDEALQAFFGKVLIYIITFFIIASYWTTHRRLMKAVKRIDARFIQLTLLFLAFITFFPVTFNMIMENGHYLQVVIIYTLISAGGGFSMSLLWWYASWKHRLIDTDLTSVGIDQRTAHSLVMPIIGCLSLLLLPVVPSPPYIFFSWILIAPVSRVLQFLYKHQQKKHNEAQQHEQPSLLSDE